MTEEFQPKQALDAWQIGEIGEVEPVSAGHINQTFFVEADGSRYVLQRLSEIFAAEVNLDIEAITAELQRAGMLTPRLIRATDGNLWHADPRGGIWRLLTFIEGESIDRVDSPDRCRAAGRLLGRFHRALWSCDHRFQHARLGVHDTPKHLATLQQALRDHRGHRLFASVEPVARAILAAAEDLPQRADELPERVVHGDPKITNIIFASGNDARCFVDLDTLARMPLHLELGDALRSWCSPQGEEVDCEIDLTFLEAALSGYAERMQGQLQTGECAALGSAAELIAIELAARFCADALNESYFGWDRARFATAGDHNLRRASAQLYLARSARASRSRIQALVDQLF